METLINKKKKFLSSTNNYLLLLTISSMILIFSSGCDLGAEGCVNEAKYINNTGMDIRIISFRGDGDTNKLDLIKNNEDLKLSSSSIGGSCPIPTFMTIDSLIVKFSDSVSITYGSKSGIDSCNGRNLFCENSFVKRNLKENYNEYTYTFTEEDYEFAKNR